MGIPGSPRASLQRREVGERARSVIATETRTGGRMTKKILIADDEPSVAEMLVQALAAEGYETFKATQSLRFYDAVREHHPDLILLDLMMPYLEGDDELVLLNMNPETRGIPVVIVTAKQDARQEIDRYRQMGVVDIVIKPYNLDHLLRIIRDAIGAP
jgi:DNA-binding response OmpR family regulator